MLQLVNGMKRNNFDFNFGSKTWFGLNLVLSIFFFKLISGNLLVIIAFLNAESFEEQIEKFPRVSVESWQRNC